ncbi:transcription elongation factor GreA [Anaerolineales bacterium HSG24]|nr:transcription elongation factor GreA [Anaerolineales bacterium HSG24]
MADKPVYLTPEGKKKLEEELEYLTTVRRREVAEAIRSAKEEGDLSENSAYDEAKLQQGFLEGRVQEIELQLRNAELIQKNGKTDTINIGNYVTVFDEDFGEEETYQIVGSAEADPSNGRISNESPVGKVLLGCKAGDMVEAETPGGTVSLKIVKFK